MCRSDVNSLRAWSTSLTDIDGNSLLIDWHRNDLRPCIVKGSHSAEVAGIFHPHRVTGLQQHSRQYIQRLLDARDNHNLIRVAVDAT